VSDGGAVPAGPIDELSAFRYDSIGYIGAETPYGEMSGFRIATSVIPAPHTLIVLIFGVACSTRRRTLCV